MIRIEVHRFGVSRTLVLVGLFAIGLIASTAVPALGSSNTWTPTGSMTTARSGDTATLLADGEVLVAGGGNATGSLTSAELYNPATGKWTATGRMTTARASHTATLLPNGEVLVSGGVSNGSSPWAPSCTSSAELYNPSTGQWTTTGSMTKPRATHTATLLDNGSVLVTGAFCSWVRLSLPGQHRRALRPIHGHLKATGSMNVARVYTAATLLPNGQVLIAGGNPSSSGGVRAPNSTIMATGR